MYILFANTAAAGAIGAKANLPGSDFK